MSASAVGPPASRIASSTRAWASRRETPADTTAPATCTTAIEGVVTATGGIGVEIDGTSAPDATGGALEVVSARGNRASVGGGGVRTSQYAPAHTTTIATAEPIRRPRPNQLIHALTCSAPDR